MELVPTGIAGLDEMLGGGFPKGRSILAIGSPGSGKTTLAVQFLVAGASHGDRGLYIALDEPPERVKEDLSGFGWDLDRLEEDGSLVFFDASAFKSGGMRSKSSTLMPELNARSLITNLARIVAGEGVARLAIDPVTSISLRYPEMAKRRRVFLALFDALSATGCTSLLTAELRTSILSRRFQLEEFLSQGVILLHTLVHEGNVIRALQVEKMRGIAHDTQLRPYQIGTGGIEVFSKDRVF